MTQSLTSPDSMLVTIVLGTLAVGLPIVFVLAIRFLWDRNLNLGRSKELEKLIWQLHRIASAMEHQMNLSFPAVQPGTEEPRDIAFLQQLPAQPAQASQAARPSPATPKVATAAAATPPTHQAEAQPQPAAAAPAPPAEPQQAPAPLPSLQEPSGEVAHRAGVNSMFGL